MISDPGFSDPGFLYPGFLDPGNLLTRISLSRSLALDARPLRLGTAALSGAPPQGAVSGESAAARGRAVGGGRGRGQRGKSEGKQ